MSPPARRVPGASQGEEDESSRSQGEHHSEEVERPEVPGREENAEGDGNGALEHHRARNVTHGQGILAVPHPEDGVELLRRARSPAAPGPGL